MQWPSAVTSAPRSSPCQRRLASITRGISSGPRPCWRTNPISCATARRAPARGPRRRRERPVGRGSTRSRSQRCRRPARRRPRLAPWRPRPSSGKGRAVSNERTVPRSGQAGGGAPSRVAHVPWYSRSSIITPSGAPTYANRSPAFSFGSDKIVPPSRRTDSTASSTSSTWRPK